MSSAEWRSFASPETVELDSDLDLAAHPVQDGSRNRLLRAGNQRGGIGEEHGMNTHFRRSYDDVTPEYSDETQTPQSRSIKDSYQDPAKLQFNVTDAPLQPSTNAYWDGNPVYALTWDVLGILVSICFLILGAFVAHLKGQEQSAWSLRVMQATRLAPSLWPILFSGVLGNAVRALADWRVERGVDLMVLEQLMGSLTLAGAVITAFKWSIVRLSSVVLILLWAFNPLGSQSSFRGVYLKEMEGSGTGLMSYYNYNSSTQRDMSMFRAGSTRARPKIRALYSAAVYDAVSSLQYVDTTNATYQNTIMMLGGEKYAATQAGTDAWGNIRIPNLQALSDYNSEAPHQWVDVPWTETIQNYSSLAGDRIEGLKQNFTGNTTFTITSSYQGFDCSSWKNLNINSGQANRWLLNNTHQNLTEITNPATALTAAQSRTFFVIRSAVYPVNATADFQPPLIFGSTADPVGLDNTAFISITQCSTRSVYVDAQVFCKSTGNMGKANCGVSSIRETLTAAVDTAPNHDDTIDYQYMDAFMDILDDAQSGSGASSIVEWYLQDPLTALNNPASFGYTNLAALDVKVFEKRLSLLWNTLWKISYQYASIMGGNMTRELPDGDFEHAETVLNTTSSTVFPLPPVYEVNVSWMIVYFISVAVMFLAAVFSLVMRHGCHAPGLLGYVSTSIKDSVYFQDEQVQGNSAEHGASKTRRLRKMKVMVADVQSGNDVGRIAFAPAEAGQRVKRGRWYE